MKRLIARFLADETGATAIEYGLIAALVALVIISSLRTIGSNLSSKLNTVATNLH